MKHLLEYLQGGDLRSIAGADEVVSLVKTPSDFDRLFQYLFSEDRLVVMRAADAVEKITLKKPEYLHGHSDEVIQLIQTASDKELKWHLALIAARMDLMEAELDGVWSTLAIWARDPKESRIVRVNSIQALFDLSGKKPKLRESFEQIARQIDAENIPSISARLRKIMK